MRRIRKVVSVLVIFTMLSACANVAQSPQQDAAKKGIDTFKERAALQEREQSAEWNSPKFALLRKWLPYNPSEILPSNLVERTMPTDEEYALLLVWADHSMKMARQNIQIANEIPSPALVANLEYQTKQLLDLFIEFNRGGMSWGQLNTGRLAVRDRVKSFGETQIAELRARTERARQERERLAQLAAEERQRAELRAAQERQRAEQLAAEDRRKQLESIDGLLTGLSYVAGAAAAMFLMGAAVAAQNPPRPQPTVTCLTSGPWTTCR